MRTNLRGVAATLGLALLLAGCGDDTASNQPAENPTAAADQPAAPAVADNPPAAPPAAETPAVAGAPAEPPATPAEPPKVVVASHQLSDIYTALQVDPAAIHSPDDYIPLAMEVCGDRQVCQVGIWNDGEVTPTALPVRSAQLKYQVFTYGRNNETGYNRSLWNCFDYPEQEGKGCIPRLLDR